MRLPVRSIIGYGAGDAANSLAFTLGTAFLLLYYTDVVGLPAAAILAMLVFVRHPLTEQRYTAMIAETDARKRALLDTPPIAKVPVPATV